MVEPVKKNKRRDFKQYPNTVSTVPIFDAKLRQLRESRRLTQAEVTEGSGLPAGRLSQYECGAANPSPEHLLKIAKFYGITPRKLITEEGIALISTVFSLLAQLLNDENPELAQPALPIGNTALPLAQ